MFLVHFFGLRVAEFHHIHLKCPDSHACEEALANLRRCFCGFGFQVYDLVQNFRFLGHERNLSLFDFKTTVRWAWCLEFGCLGLGLGFRVLSSGFWAGVQSVGLSVCRQ